MRLKGKKALITGGARGIGRGIAIKFLAEGADVILLDKREDQLAATVKEIKETTNLLSKNDNEFVVNVESVVCDLNITEQVNEAADYAWNLWGGIDILVNNAGIAVREQFTEIPYSRWLEIMNINLNAMFLLSQNITKRMISGKIKGSIVNMASKNGLAGSSMLAHYNSSKAGVVMLTQSMCVELAEFGIRVNAVAPGFIDTPMDRELKEKEEKSFLELSRTPMRRYGTTVEVANAVSFLASEEASYITGATLVIDGGHMANASEL